MRDKMLIANTPRIPLVGIVLLLFTVVPFSSTSVRIAFAAAPITPSGLNTQVTLSATPPAGKTQYDITGGTRPGGGANLFHSFGDFNVPNNNIANFLNDSGLATSNILGRVTGGTISNIFGTIQTTGFGNANLFLMNPAGFLFGPNATVNVGGMVAFTSADYLRLADGVRFNATPNAAADALLTPSPVAAFGFLGSNPGAITVQGSQFTVTEGTGISLVGGNITIQSGTLDNGTVQSAKLSAPGGQINIASVASPGEVLASNLQLQANVNGASFTSLGNVSIGQDARIETAGATAGTIMIRGGQLLVADGATITSATSSDPSAPAGSVTINGTGVQLTGSDVALNGTNVSVTGSTVTATNLDGSGGTITITAGSTAQPGNVTLAQGALLDASGDRGGSVSIHGKQLVMTDATISADTGNTSGASTAIDINLTGDMSIADTRGLPALTARTTGDGDAGTIQIHSGNLAVTSTSPAIFALIDTHTSGAGRAGDINITTGNLQASYQGGGIVQFTDSGTTGPGHGGNVTISADSVAIEGMGINTGDSFGSFFGQEASGSAGNVTITADRITLLNSTIDTSALLAFDSSEVAGSATLNASDINLTQSVVSALGFGGGGAFTFTANKLILDGGSHLESLTAAGPGGGIRVNASVVELLNGSTIATTTAGDGQAGDIHVTATDHLTLSTSPFSSDPSGFFSNSTGDLGSGNAGAIVVTTPRLDMTGGSRINTTTLSSGRGGDVTINSTNSISISGEFPSADPEPIFGVGVIHPSGIFTKTAGSDLCSGPCGNAGNISITTGSLVLGNGAQIDSGTSNNGLGGNITIHATNSISMSGTLSDGSPVGVFSRTIGTDPGAGNGGNILLKANSVTIQNGAQLSASSLGPGNAGSVTIEGTASPAQSVLIDGAGSGIFTDTQGTGAGGNIVVNANSVTLQDGGTVSAATSGTGDAGNIHLTADKLTLDGFSFIQANADFGSQGRGGNIDVQVREASLAGGSAILTGTLGLGDAGNITILADERLTLTGAATIATSSVDSFGNGAGNAGLIHLTAPTIELQGGNLFSFSLGPGNAGNIILESTTFTAGNQSLITSQTIGPGRGGDISIRGLGGPGSRAGDVTISGQTTLTSSTSGDGRAGDITVLTERLTLTNSLMNTSTVAAGDAGNITVDASKSVQVSTVSVLQSSSGVGPTGNAGQITVTTPSLTVDQGGIISTSTSGTGNAGSILVNADSVSLLNGGQLTSSSSIDPAPGSPPPSGSAGTVTIKGLASPAQSVLIDGSGSGIFTDTQGTGAGGNIVVNANTVTLQNGGTLSAATSGTDVSATGGTITVIAPGQMAMTGGSSISASSSGPANAGDISINAGQQLTMQNSSITTEASQASGGNITIQAVELVGLATSQISASVLGGPQTTGGNITIDPNLVILQNSQITANAVHGNGGNIALTTNFLIVNNTLIGATTPVPASAISASSEFGQNGTITVQSPNAPASGKIIPLSQKPLMATSLLNQRCASLAGGEFSSFTVAGRDSLPTEPGAWLASPLALGSAGTGSGPLADNGERAGMDDDPAGEKTILSLRQIAPAGFLTQTFALDWSAGCQS